MRIMELLKLEVGDDVYWNDPDNEECSGTRRIIEIVTESGLIENLESVVVLADNEGSCIEAYVDELLYLNS